MKSLFHMTDETKTKVLSNFFGGMIYPYRQKTKPPFQSRNFNLCSGFETAALCLFGQKFAKRAKCGNGGICETRKKEGILSTN
jgi:hypothetical protein